MIENLRCACIFICFVYYYKNQKCYAGFLLVYTELELHRHKIQEI